MQNFKAFYLLLDKHLYGPYGCSDFDQSTIVDTKRNHDKSYSNKALT